MGAVWGDGDVQQARIDGIFDGRARDEAFLGIMRTVRRCVTWSSSWAKAEVQGYRRNASLPG